MQDQERLAFALEATQTGLWTFEPTADRIVGDGTVAAVIGLNEPAPLTSESFIALFADNHKAEVRALLDNPAVAMGSETEREFPIRRLDTGVVRWIAIRARRSDDGTVLGTARDVTDTRRHDDQVHELMREVTHRSKNLLAIIQAMARQTVKDSLSATEFEGRFSARLRGLSFSHELLASQDWRGASLSALAEGHLSPLRERHGDRVAIEGPVVFIRPEAAQNIGLALNELSSNAQRFGALAGATGTVRLEWAIDADERGARALVLTWTEAGAGTAVRPPDRQGFGHRVMERVVARALDAAVTMTFAPTGLNWSLRIPLVHIAGDAAAA